MPSRRSAGYNKSLIFQYFGDKLGLYAAVNKRVDRDISELEARILAPLLEDETIASDAHRFRTFLETAIGALFDYLLEHPRLSTHYSLGTGRGLADLCQDLLTI